MALGGVATKPWRSAEAEKALVGNRPGEEAYVNAANAALEGAKAWNDVCRGPGPPGAKSGHQLSCLLSRLTAPRCRRCTMTKKIRAAYSAFMLAGEIVV